MMKSFVKRASILTFAAVFVLTVGALMLVAQVPDEPDVFGLRQWLIDRIEAAYTAGDTAVLQRMAGAEYENDLQEWLHEPAAAASNPSSVRQAVSDAGGNENDVCPEGYGISHDGFCYEGDCMVANGYDQSACAPFDPNLWFDVPPTPVQLPPPPPPPPPPGLSWPGQPNLGSGGCASVWEAVARCALEREFICELADDDEVDGLDELCADKTRTCAEGLALAVLICSN